MRLAWPSLFVVTILSLLALTRPAQAATDDNWHKLTTKHFELYTDLDEKTAVETAKELETTRAALITAAWPRFQFPEVVRTRVFVLANGLDFERYLGRYTWGLFSGGARPAFFLYGAPSRWTPRYNLRQKAPNSVLRHEMTHQLSTVVFQHAPLWFLEGLAQFLETAQISQDGQSVVVGRGNLKAEMEAKLGRTIPLQEVLDWGSSAVEHSDRETAGIYGKAWLLFHWLYNNRQEEFAAFQLALVQGDDVKQAWESAFPKLNLDEVDSAMYVYLRNGEAAVDTLPLVTAPPTVDVTTMSRADAHAALGQIALVGASLRGKEDESSRKAARAEVKKALELDPTNIDALLLDTWTSVDERLESARQAAKEHPEDGRVFALLGGLLSAPKEREAAYRRALELNREDPNVLNDLASLLLELRRPQEALPFALRAVKRAPHNANVIDTYAEALFKLDRCLDSLKQQLRASEQAREASAQLKAQMSERLIARRTACKASLDAAPRTVRATLAHSDFTPRPDEATPSPAASTKKLPSHYPAGLFVNLNVGYGYGYGSYLATRGRTQAGDFQVGGVDITGAIGGTMLPGISLAFEVGIFAHPDFGEQLKFDGGARVTNLAVTRFGLAGDVDVGSSGFHAMTGFDYALGFWNGDYGVSKTTFLPLDEVATGFFWHLAFGYAWTVRYYDIGPALRFHYAKFSSERTDASLSGLTAMLGVFY